MTVTFSPTAIQSYSGNIVVNSNALSGSGMASVSGLGSAAPISFSGNLSFSNVNIGESASISFVAQNIGNIPLTVNAISFPNGFNGSWSGTLAAGASVSIPVLFSPTSAQGYGGRQSYVGNIVVTYSTSKFANATS